MPAPPLESEPAMVNIAGVWPSLCAGKEYIVVVSMTSITSPPLYFLGRGAVYSRHDIT
jgi:hypothetical protein